MHVHMFRKDDILRQRRLNHSGVGGGISFRRVYPARAYSTVVVLVKPEIATLNSRNEIFSACKHKKAELLVPPDPKSQGG